VQGHFYAMVLCFDSNRICSVISIQIIYYWAASIMHVWPSSTLGCQHKLYEWTALKHLLHLGVWSWSRQSPELQTECQNGKERWFKQFWAWHGWLCQPAGMSISQSAQLLGLSRATISRVYKEWCEKENALLMLEVRGE